jgi:hypothetical protein
MAKLATIPGGFSVPLRLIHFRTRRRRIGMNLGSRNAADQLITTYESWIVRRESWLPPFPLTRRSDRDRDATGSL